MSSNHTTSAESLTRRTGFEVGKDAFPIRGIVRGTGWNLLGQVVPGTIALILTPLLVQHLGLVRYGLLALMLAVSTFLSSFDGGIGPTASRYFAVFAGASQDVAATEFLTTVLLLLVVVGGILSLGGIFLAPFAMSLFGVHGSLRVQGLFLFRTVGVLASVAFLHSVFVAVLNARSRYGLTAITNIASYIVWALGVVYVIETKGGLRGIAISLIAQQILASLLIVPPALRYFSRHNVGLMKWKDLRDVLGYSVRIQTSALSTIVNEQVDVFVIGILLSVKKAGIFSVGGNIALQARGAIGNALVPIANHMSRSFGSGGVEAALAEFVRLQRMWVRLTTGWFCGVAGVSYFAIVAWLGPQFKLGAIAAVVLLFGYMVNLYTGMLTIYLNAIGRPGIETRYGLVSMGVNLVLTCGLAVFGVLGIAAATAIGTATGSIFLVRIAHRRVSQQIPSFTRLIPIVPGGMAFAISFCVSGVVGRVVPQGVVGLAAVGACALAGLFAYSLAVVGPKDVAQGIRSPRHLPRTLASAFMGADQDAGTVTDAGGS